MLKLWLLPKVWLQGSQSTTTGGSSATKAKPAAIIAWFEHSMRWVLMTALGVAGRAGGEQEFRDGVRA